LLVIGEVVRLASADRLKQQFSQAMFSQPYAETSRTSSSTTEITK
jgi:hypothetical protein